MTEADDVNRDLLDGVNRDLLIALQAVVPLLERARLAYRFWGPSYAYDALLACGQAHDLALAAIKKATRGAAQ